MELNHQAPLSAGGAKESSPLGRITRQSRHSNKNLAGEAQPEIRYENSQQPYDDHSLILSPANTEAHLIDLKNASYASSSLEDAGSYEEMMANHQDEMASNIEFDTSMDGANSGYGQLKRNGSSVSFDTQFQEFSYKNFNVLQDANRHAQQVLAAPSLPLSAIENGVGRSSVSSLNSGGGGKSQQLQ